MMRPVYILLCSTLGCYAFHLLPAALRFSPRELYQRSFVKKLMTVNEEEHIFREQLPGNFTDDASTLLVSDVTSFGINTALAEEHIALGNFEEAETLARRAMELGEHRHDANNIYSAYAEGILADALYKERKFQVAADHYHNALKIYERHYRSTTSPEVVEMVGAVQMIAWTMLSNRDFDDAKAACATALGMTEKLLGPNSTDVAASMVNLATAYINTGDSSATPEILLKKALEVFLTHQDPRDYDVDSDDIATKIANVYLTLGNLYYLQGEDDKAEEQYEKVEKAQRSVHPETVAAALKSLGHIRWRKGDTRRAQELLTKALHTLEQTAKAATGLQSPQQKALETMIHGLKTEQPPPPPPFVDRAKLRHPHSSVTRLMMAFRDPHLM